MVQLWCRTNTLSLAYTANRNEVARFMSQSSLAQSHHRCLLLLQICLARFAIELFA